MEDIKDVETTEAASEAPVESIEEQDEIVEAPVSPSEIPVVE